MALLILALLQRIFIMSSLMLLLVWLIFFMVLIKLLPIRGTISGKTVKLMVLALICLGNNRLVFQAEDCIRYYKVTGVQTCALPICRPGNQAHLAAEVASHGERPFRTLTIGYFTFSLWSAAIFAAFLHFRERTTLRRQKPKRRR